MTKNKDFHILYSCPDKFPDSFADKETQEIKTNGLNLKIEKRPILPYASLEWAIPGLIVVYIAKPYFESFLKEAGKDHYHILVKWLKKIAINSRLINVKTLTASQSSEKTNKSNSQSKAISIYIMTSDNRRIKLAKGRVLRKEQKVYGILRELFPKEYIRRHDRKTLNGLELDFYLYNLKLGIEYDGEQHFDRKLCEDVFKSDFDALVKRDRDKYQEKLIAVEKQYNELRTKMEPSMILNTHVKQLLGQNEQGRVLLELKKL